MSAAMRAPSFIGTMIFRSMMAMSSSCFSMDSRFSMRALASSGVSCWRGPWAMAEIATRQRRATAGGQRRIGAPECDEARVAGGDGKGTPGVAVAAPGGCFLGKKVDQVVASLRYLRSRESGSMTMRRFLLGLVL